MTAVVSWAHATHAQVALDLPGHGKVTTLRRGDSHVSSDFLADVIRALGKQSAYAIVGQSDATSCILQAVLEQPSLCSFAICIEPQVPCRPPTEMGPVPVLPSSPRPLRAVRSLLPVRARYRLVATQRVGIAASNRSTASSSRRSS